MKFIEKGPNKVIYQDNKILKFLVESSKYGDKEVIIDVEDWDRIKKYRWYINYNKCIDNFYVKAVKYIGNKRFYYQLHRLILNVIDPKIHVDHKFHNTLDNRKSVLRKCTSIKNLQNKRIHFDNTSGFKGVCWHKSSKKWQAKLTYNSKYIYLGIFENKIQAAKIYNEAAIKYYGEFACLNEGI